MQAAAHRHGGVTANYDQSIIQPAVDTVQYLTQFGGQTPTRLPCGNIVIRESGLAAKQAVKGQYRTALLPQQL